MGLCLRETFAVCPGVGGLRCYSLKVGLFLFLHPEPIMAIHLCVTLEIEETHKYQNDWGSFS